MTGEEVQCVSDLHRDLVIFDSKGRLHRDEWRVSWIERLTVLNHRDRSRTLEVVINMISDIGGCSRAKADVISLIVSLVDYGNVGVPIQLFSDALLAPNVLFSTDVILRDAVITAVPAMCALDSAFASRLIILCLEDIRTRVHRRTGVRDDRKESGSEAVLGYPDAEGWGSLETSQKALTAALASMEHSLDISEDILSNILEIIPACVNHTNRFAREQGQLCLEQLAHIYLGNNPELFINDLFVPLMTSGLQDNWSQVRYAALRACRAILRECVRTRTERVLEPDIAPLLLINRHFVAEGVRRYAQETWRILVGPQGGVDMINRHQSHYLELLVAACESSNQSVREAVISVVLEFLRRVFIPAKQVSIDAKDVTQLLKLCVNACEDESWPVRDIGARSTLVLYRELLPRLDEAVVTLLERKLDEIVSIILDDVFDPMTPLREIACEAVGFLVALRSNSNEADDPLWETVFKLVSKGLPAWRHCNAHDLDLGGSHDNRPMYSCGTLLASTKRISRKNLSDDCCGAGACGVSVASSALERSDGALRLGSALLGGDNLKKNQKQSIISLLIPTIVDLITTLEGENYRGLRLTAITSLSCVLKQRLQIPSELMQSIRQAVDSQFYANEMPVRDEVISLLATCHSQ